MADTRPLATRLLNFIRVETVRGKTILRYDEKEMGKIIDAEVAALVEERLQLVAPSAIATEAKPVIDSVVADLKTEISRLKTHIHNLYVKEASRIGLKV